MKQREKLYCVLWLTLCVACGAASKQAPTTHPATPPAPKNDRAPNITLLDAVSPAKLKTSFYTPASNDPGKPGITPWTRRELDVSAVIGLVKERLSNVALLAAGDVLRGLTSQATRPWARDLLRVTADLTKANSVDRRPLAESALRVVARAVLADALARTAVAHQDAATRDRWADWAYWALAESPLLADASVNPPAHPMEPAALDELRRRVAMALEGIRLFARLRETLSQGRATPHELLELLVSARDLGSLGDLRDRLERARQELTRELNSYASLYEKLTSFARSKAGMRQVWSSPTPPTGEALDNVKHFADQAREVLDTRLEISNEELTVQQWAEKLTSSTVRVAIARVHDELKRSPRDYRKLQDALGALGNDFPALPNDLLELPPILDDLMTLIAPAGVTRTLDSLRFEDAKTFGKLAASAISHLNNVTSIKHISAKAGEDFASLSTALSGIKELIATLETLAGAARDTTLGDVHGALHALRSTMGKSFSAPVLEVLAPVVEKLAEGRQLTAADLYLAVTKLGPTTLLRALALSSDGTIGGACASDTSWQCWAARLAMSLHGALEVTGDSISVQPDALMKSVASLGAWSRQNEPGSFHLLASVGIGTMYADDQWRPLVAEQLGGTIVVVDRGKATASVGLFASGLLYRFVIDDEVSNGLMFGLTTRLRVYGMIEAHADLTGVLTYEAAGDDDFHLGVVLGLQVPLGDYLERADD